MLVLGSAHVQSGDVSSRLDATCRAADASVALQTGDLDHYDLPIPTYFVAGLQEELDVIDALRLGRVQSPSVANVHLLASTAVEVEGLRIGGLSGTYSDAHFSRPRSRLHRDHRRHFTRREVERASKLDVDVFLLYEPPPTLIDSDPDAALHSGCRSIEKLLATIRPSLCLVGGLGHHAETHLGDTKIVSLAPIDEQFYTLDPETLSLTRHEPPEQ